MNCVSCDICVYHLGLCAFFPGVFLSSRVTGACPVTTDLIMRVNARTTTTTHAGRVFFLSYIRHNQCPCRLCIRMDMKVVVTQLALCEESIALYRSFNTEPETNQTMKHKQHQCYTVWHLLIKELGGAGVYWLSKLERHVRPSDTLH